EYRPPGFAQNKFRVFNAFNARCQFGCAPSEDYIMMKRIGRRSLITLLIIVCLIPFGAVSMAQEGRASADFTYITGVNVVSTCSNVAINFLYMTNQPLYLTARVEYLGQIVTDDLISLP